ncbi:MAG: drug/metabolite transporter (DMT)-like permease [Gammaproteobacteria bacterium]|jgi:drug/metabolite transporter (DMT)-like permease
MQAVSLNNSVVSPIQNNHRGIVFVICAMTVFSVQDVLIKLLSDQVSLFQVLFIRSLVGVFLIAGFLKITGQAVKFGTAYPFLSSLRGVLFFFAYSAFYFAQSKMPIANALVLFLVSPFFITILSIFAFGSQVGYSRWITMIIGFFGVVVISQPEFGEFNLFYLLPVMVALIYAISMTIAKKTADKDTVYQQVIIMYTITAVLSGALGFLIGDGQYDTPEFSAIQFMTRAWNFDGFFIISSLAAITIVGTVGFLMLTSAYRIADPATITPFEYSGLISAIIWGFVFWNDIPSMKEIIGMTLIVGSGMFLFYREMVRGQQTAMESPLR